MKLWGEEVRHSPLKYCSGTFHVNSQRRKLSCPKALVAQRTRGGLRESAATLWTLSVTTTAPLALTGTSISQALGSVNDSCPQDMSWGRSCRNKVEAQLAFKKPTATGKFSSHRSWKKQKPKCPQQDRMLRIPNYCRNANQNENKRSSPIRASSGGYTKGKRAWGKGTPLHSRREGTLTTSSIMDSL